MNGKQELLSGAALSVQSRPGNELEAARRRPVRGRGLIIRVSSGSVRGRGLITMASSGSAILPGGASFDRGVYATRNNKVMLMLMLLLIMMMIKIIMMMMYMFRSKVNRRLARLGLMYDLSALENAM
jgi:threonine/homoserine/homoserine lactone efflux protein